MVVKVQDTLWLQVKDENATRLRIKGLVVPLAYLPGEGPEAG